MSNEENILLDDISHKCAVAPPISTDQIDWPSGRRFATLWQSSFSQTQKCLNDLITLIPYFCSPNRVTVQFLAMTKVLVK